MGIGPSDTVHTCIKKLATAEKIKEDKLYRKVEATVLS
jgi:hypothetical protein